MTTTLTNQTPHLMTDEPGRAAVKRAAPRRLPFHSVERAVADIAAGRAVVLLDHTRPVSEGDLIIAAQQASIASLAFMVRHGSGFVCVPMTAQDCERLALPPIQPTWNRGHTPAYTVTVDAGSGIGTGISASDRATTIRVLADAATGPHDLTRPGHVVPIAAHDGGVLARPGRPEAAVDLRDPARADHRQSG
jgi:3,4-dihydroxy 2-butanone 4-phosphate synthase/GTP cyclohydrolase II